MVLTIHEFAEKYSISIHKLKKMKAQGDVIFREGSKAIPDAMRYRLNRKQTLTVQQMMLLLKNPKMISELEHEALAKKQIASLGLIGPEALEPGQRGMVVECARNFPESSIAFAQWLRERVPADGCSYHYLAVRVLWLLNDSQFKTVYPLLARAIMIARRQEPLAGMSSTEKGTTKFFRRFYDL